MNTSEIEVLFAQTLIGDYDGEAAWAAVATLHQNGSRQIFDYAAAWCLSGDPLKRARAAAVLCQLRTTIKTSEKRETSEPILLDESYSLLTNMLQHEQNPMVLDSVICGLGHLRNSTAAPLIFEY